MRKILSYVLVALIASSGVVWADLTVLDGTGASKVIKNFVCETTKLCNATVLIKSDGTEIGTTSNPVAVALPAATVTTLTPPAAITGFGTAANQTTLIGHVDGIETLITSTNTKLDTLNGNVSAAIPAGTNLIGDVNLRQGGTALSATNGAFANVLQGNAVLSATNGMFSNCLLGNAACATGTGAVGSTSQRIAVGTDTATLAGSTPAVAGFAATGAAPPTGSQQMGAVGSGATGGLMAGLKTCDLHAKYDASDNGSITMVTGVSGRKVYICGFILATGGTATNLKLREGSDANCATNGADLTPAYQLVANDKIGMQAAFWTGLVVSTNAYYVCVNASAGNAHQAEVWYTIQ